MVSTFLIYDLTFLVVFTIAVTIFLILRRKNLKREGIIFLYRTKFGIKAIDWFAEKFEPILKPLQYITLTSGYILLILAVWLIADTTYIYFKYPIVAETIKAPPLAPLIPYFPTLFGLQSFFPQLSFTVFIVALSIVAISHEFTHGIFSRLYKLKIKATGIVFLGPILGAFVEPDEKKMEKISKFKQLTILAGGTFANVVMAALFIGIIWLLFVSAFHPVGVKFDSYATSPVQISTISSVNGTAVQNLSSKQLTSTETVPIKAGNQTYFLEPSSILYSLQNNISYVVAFDNSSAYRAKLQGAIMSINHHPTTNYQELSDAILSVKPGVSIPIKTQTANGTKITNITIGQMNGKPFLGVGINEQNYNALGVFINTVIDPQNKEIYYTNVLGSFGDFLYNLFWWVIVINLLVAIFNMLPLSILDGGRFFYLTVWGITRKEKIGKWAFKASSWLILAVFVALMIKWAFTFA